MQGALHGREKEKGGEAEAIGHLPTPQGRGIRTGKGGSAVDTETKLPAYARGR